jgi:predicted ArsR family transcriptional regulator
MAERSRRGIQGLHAALAAPARVRLLDTMRAVVEPLDARELGEMCGLHVNTTRFHLDVLADAGLVAREPQLSGRRGRPRLLYRAVVGSAGASARAPYALLAGMLASHWDGDGDGSLRAERAGYASAAAMIVHTPRTGTAEARGHAVEADLGAQLTPVVALFAELGFEPDVVEDGSAIQLRLHACPFRAVAAAHPEVVCSLHLGLLRGALERLGVPASADELRPFVEPQLCTATLTPRGSARPEPAGRPLDDEATSRRERR